MFQDPSVHGILVFQRVLVWQDHHFSQVSGVPMCKGSQCASSLWSTVPVCQGVPACQDHRLS